MVEKKTFKEKLRGMIVEAEIAQNTAIREHQLQDPRSLSIDLLTSGCPSAYCEFHELVTGHLPRATVTDDQSTPPFIAEPLSLDILRSVQSQLINVELALGQGDRFAEFDAYNQLVRIRLSFFSRNIG